MDEAYQPFSCLSWLDEIRRDPASNQHVLLMRTLSKFGLAGARLGYMLAPTALLNEVDKLRPPYNVSVLNARVRFVCAGKCRRLRAQAKTICEERTALTHALQAMPGVTPFPSDANMLARAF
jgi:histidinol-phosphate aminotransferase